MQRLIHDCYEKESCFCLPPDSRFFPEICDRILEKVPWSETAAQTSKKYKFESLPYIF